MFRSAGRRFLRYSVLCFFSICFVLALIYQQTQQREVPGWGINVSRDTRLYVQPDNNTSIISASELCTPTSTKPLLLLVIVCSSVPHFDRRGAIRETWASELNPDIRVAFLLGGAENLTLQTRVEEESNSKNDIIQEGFIDSYNNLTLKSVMMLKWVQRYCGSIKFLMKTDDDTFVNVGALDSLLRNTTRTNLLLGSLIWSAQPVLDTRSKYYIPYYMFQGQIYPNYLSGSGYVMSRDVISRLYDTALELPLIHIEDVYITGICAKKAGIWPRDHPGFSYFQRRLSESCNPDYLTNHGLNSDDFHTAWSLCGFV